MHGIGKRDTETETLTDVVYQRNNHNVGISLDQDEITLEQIGHQIYNFTLIHLLLTNLALDWRKRCLVWLFGM